MIMVKAAIISWIVLGVLVLITRVMAQQLTTEEKLVYQMTDRLPNRFVPMGLLLLLSIIVSVVLSIIAIVTF